MRKIKMKKRINGFLPIIIILILSFIAEAFLSNFVCFAYVAGSGEVENYISGNNETVFIYEDHDVLSDDIPNFKLNSLSFNIRQNKTEAENQLVSVDIRVYDGNSPEKPTTVRSEKISVGASPRKVTFYMRSQGNASGYEAYFYNYSGEMIITDTVINPEYEFSFDAIRFCLIFIVLCIIQMLRENGNAKKLRDSISYEQAMIISVTVCVASSILFWVLNASRETANCIAYPLDGYVDNYSPYIQQFDAFMKGQLHLDVIPTEGIMQLENPYSPSAREGIYYLYDRAFFDGKYYSYFGIVPIILIYFPFYLIFNVLPLDSTVMGMFSLITAVFLPMAVVKWAKSRKNGISPWFSAICAVTAFFASSTLLIQRGFTPFYYVASLAGMAFVSAFIFWMLCATDENKKAKKLIYFALAGIAFAFAFLSRLNSVVAPAIVIAVFVILYLIKKIKEKDISGLISEMAVLALPVAASLAFSLYYNYIRFGNPLQFGADYQLTIADASLYEISADGIIPSIIHYFLQPFGLRAEFPYIGFDYFRLSDYGRFVYVDSNFGIFAIPFMLSLFLSPFVLKSKKVSRNTKILLVSGIASLFITAFVNYCLGGVIFRYTADISLIAAFISAVILLEISVIINDLNYASVFKKTTVAFCAVSVIVSLAASIQLNGNLVSYEPDIYVALKDFFVIRS